MAQSSIVDPETLKWNFKIFQRERFPSLIRRALILGLAVFEESEACLIAKQARPELLNRVAKFCGLERGDTEEQKRVMGIKHPYYHDSARATINLALPWHSVAEEIADLNFKIVTGQLNKRVKSCHSANPWGSRVFFTGVGYHTHNLEGYVLNPVSGHTF